MKLIIDISDEHYRNICKRAEYFGKRSIVLAPHEKAIADGTPLPKGHGRLVDMNVALKVLADEWGYEGIEDDLEYKVPTIIEADKGE